MNVSFPCPRLANHVCSTVQPAEVPCHGEAGRKTPSSWASWRLSTLSHLPGPGLPSQCACPCTCMCMGVLVVHTRILSACEPVPLPALLWGHLSLQPAAPAGNLAWSAIAGHSPGPENSPQSRLSGWPPLTLLGPGLSWSPPPCWVPRSSSGLLSRARVAPEPFQMQAWNSRKGGIVGLEVRSVTARARARGRKELSG